MKPVVAVIAQGQMGAGVGRRLAEDGADVRTLLAGRSPESHARAAAAGMVSADEDGIAVCDLVLSIVPPGEALSLAERLQPALQRANRKPVYVDCNAVSPATVRAVAKVVEATGAPFVDAGIIGGPPKAGGRGPTFYASGAAAREFAVLEEFGLVIKVLDGPVGEASALKMSYAGVTKGLTALAATMVLAGTRTDAAALLAAELAASQPELARWIASSLPGMYPKAYRWVAEMREIAAFIGRDQPEARILDGAADLYERMAADFDGKQTETGALSAFVELLRQR
jgi:3-hydroxyisobutyrate dehydrogenase-like beta-hydroxyacid dehydrogenase